MLKENLKEGLQVKGEPKGRTTIMLKGNLKE